MGADLFESYVGSIIAAMTLAAITFADDPNMKNLAMLPLAIAAVGIVASVIGTFFVLADETSPLGPVPRPDHRLVATMGAAYWLVNTLDFPTGVVR